MTRLARTLTSTVASRDQPEQAIVASTSFINSRRPP